MSKKEYGKGFTLEDLDAQRQALMDTRRSLGLTPPPPAAPPPVDPFLRMQRSLTGMLDTLNAIGVWPNPLLPGDRLPPMRAQRWLPGDQPPPKGRAGVSGDMVQVGTFSGMPVFRAEDTPRGGSASVRPGLVVGSPGNPSLGYSTVPNTGPGWRSEQVGWLKTAPDPIPDQPTGRFKNLDFE